MLKITCTTHFLSAGCSPCKTQGLTASQSTWQEPSSVHEQVHCSQGEINRDKKAQNQLKYLPPIARFWPSLELNTRPYTTLRAPIPFTAPQCSCCRHSSGFLVLCCCFLFCDSSSWILTSTLSLISHYRYIPQASLDVHSFPRPVTPPPAPTWKWNPLPSMAGVGWSCSKATKNSHGENFSFWNIFSARSFVSCSSGYYFSDNELQCSKNFATKLRDHHAVILEKPLPHKSGRHMVLGCAPTCRPTILLRGKSAVKHWWEHDLAHKDYKFICVRWCFARQGTEINKGVLEESLEGKDKRGISRKYHLFSQIINISCPPKNIHLWCKKSLRQLHPFKSKM